MTSNTFLIDDEMKSKRGLSYEVENVVSWEQAIMAREVE